MDWREDKRDNKRTFVSAVIFLRHAAPRLALLKRRSPLKHLVDRKPWSEGVVAGDKSTEEREKRSGGLTGAEYKLEFISPVATPAWQINIGKSQMDK